jgi:small-conductance mechanosensitive channel
MESDQANPGPPDAAPGPVAEHFYSGALDRIRRFMLILTPLLVAAIGLKFGLRSALGLAAGCVIAYLNFHWLKRVVTALGERATGTTTTQSGKGVVFRFLLRYVLMALGAYAILTVSPASLNGLLAGLFLPVGAIACEAAYELYVALSRGL